MLSSIILYYFSLSSWFYSYSCSLSLAPFPIPSFKISSLRAPPPLTSGHCPHPCDPHSFTFGSMHPLFFLSLCTQRKALNHILSLQLNFQLFRKLQTTQPFCLRLSSCLRTQNPIVSSLLSIKYHLLNQELDTSPSPPTKTSMTLWSSSTR